MTADCRLLTADWVSTSTFRSVPRSATTATSIAVSSTPRRRRGTCRRSWLRSNGGPAGRRGRPGGQARRDTIYFGGGTPSLLEPVEVAGIIAACREAFDVASDAEVTLEANPESVDEARLAAFRHAGVNRLSFGVQSFRDDELRRLSRLHTVERATLAVGEARRAGFDNLSLDLMMWLPEQSVEQWLRSIDAAIALRPEHVSLYLLEVYPNAPLREDMARARWSQAPDDDAAAMYVGAMERLESAGFEQYQISNVARPGRRSRHNLKYWTDGEWLGFGCGAHTTRDGVRTKNVSGTDEYIACIDGGRTPARRNPPDVRRRTPRRRPLHGPASCRGRETWRRFATATASTSGSDTAPNWPITSTPAWSGARATASA